MDIKEIKNKIPFGGIKVIAKRSKVHYITAVAFFNGKKKVSEKTETTILLQTAKYLKDLKAKRQKAHEIITTTTKNLN